MGGWSPTLSLSCWLLLFDFWFLYYILINRRILEKFSSGSNLGIINSGDPFGLIIYGIVYILPNDMIDKQRLFNPGCIGKCKFWRRSYRKSRRFSEYPISNQLLGEDLSYVDILQKYLKLDPIVLGSVVSAWLIIHYFILVMTPDILGILLDWWEKTVTC